jgi:DNA-binding MarR family transcriptional regulator
MDTIVRGERSDVTNPIDDAISDLLWGTLSVGHYWQQINTLWASQLGLTFYQWMVIRAIRSLDLGGGVAVKKVAKQLCVDASSVTSQTKTLETLGLVKKTVSPTDARVVLLSLTPLGEEKLAILSDHRKLANGTLLEGLDLKTLQAQGGTIADLRDRLFRVSRRLQADMDSVP